MDLQRFYERQTVVPAEMARLETDVEAAIARAIQDGHLGSYPQKGLEPQSNTNLGCSLSPAVIPALLIRGHCWAVELDLGQGSGWFRAATSYAVA